MICCDGISKPDIAFHYDLASPFYWLFWGPHVHHGFWEFGNETPAEARERLMVRMARHMPPNARVLDVGCGMGGSSLWLADLYDCEKTVGLTLSVTQLAIARMRAAVQLARHSSFLLEDAETVEFPVESFDFLWSIECTEHLFDKPAFFKRSATWVRPGGQLAIAAWLAAEEPNPCQAQLAKDVCEGMLCPSLGSATDYLMWLAAAGYRDIRFEDITNSVTATWEICRDRVRLSPLRWLGRLGGRQMAKFLDRFTAILDAYKTGAMRYGVFTGTRETLHARPD